VGSHSRRIHPDGRGWRVILTNNLIIRARSPARIPFHFAGASTKLVSVGGTLKVDTTTNRNIGGLVRTRSLPTQSSERPRVKWRPHRVDTWGSSPRTRIQRPQSLFRCDGHLRLDRASIQRVSWRFTERLSAPERQHRQQLQNSQLAGHSLGAVTTTTATTSAPAETRAGRWYSKPLEPIVG